MTQSNAKLGTLVLYCAYRTTSTPTATTTTAPTTTTTAAATTTPTTAATYCFGHHGYYSYNSPSQSEEQHASYTTAVLVEWVYADLGESEERDQ